MRPRRCIRNRWTRKGIQCLYRCGSFGTFKDRITIPWCKPQCAVHCNRYRYLHCRISRYPEIPYQEVRSSTFSYHASRDFQVQCINEILRKQKRASPFARRSFFLLQDFLDLPKKWSYYRSVFVFFEDKQIGLMEGK